MKVVVVEPIGRGGMIHYAFQLARGLSRSGCDVVLVTSTDFELAGLPRPFSVQPVLRLWDSRPAGVPMRRGLANGARRAWRALLWYREWLRLVLLLRRLRPDWVLFGDIRFPGDLLPLLLLRTLGFPLADICHNVKPYLGGGFSGSGWLRAAYRRIYQQFAVVFVHFEINRQLFLDSYATDPRRLSVIRHGNEEIFRELASGVLPALPGGGSGSGPIVLCFGTLSRYKGADVLLEAFVDVRAAMPTARLVFAGFPAPDFDLAAHRALQLRLGLGESVIWVPRYLETNEVAGWMDSTAVAVFPHREVFQSGVLHVAQTFGVPIVATAVGATPEVIEHDVSGLLVPPGDAPALAAAVIALLRDPARARRLADHAARDAGSEFGWDRIGQTIRERLA